MSALLRPIEQWVEIFSKLPSPAGQSPEEIMADRLIGDLIGYRMGAVRRRPEDAKQIANAMQAYARMVQEAGLKV